MKTNIRLLILAIVFMFLAFIAKVCSAQIIHQDAHIILSIEDGAIWIEPTIPNTHYIVWNGVDKLDFAWLEFTSKEWLLPYDFCVGHTIFLNLYRYNVEGLNLINEQAEIYEVGRYGFYINGDKK